MYVKLVRKTEEYFTWCLILYSLSLVSQNVAPVGTVLTGSVHFKVKVQRSDWGRGLISLG